MIKVGKELLEVTPEEMDGLRDKLQRYLPESATIHGALLIRKVFKGMSDVSETKIYHSSISSLVVATPAFSQKEMQSMTIFWDTDTEDEAEVARLLLTLPKIDWTQSVLIGVTPINVLEKVIRVKSDVKLATEILSNVGNSTLNQAAQQIQRMVERGALGDGFLRSHGISIAAHLYSIKKTLNEPCLPEGLELRPLTYEHAGFVFSHWKYNFFENFETFKELLRIAPGIGIFKRSENPAALRYLKEDSLAHRVISDCRVTINSKSKNDKDAIDNYEHGSKAQPKFECTSPKEKEPYSKDCPIAWSLINQFNFFANTFTLEVYRGNKLATIVTSAMIKRALQETGYASGLIVDDNLVSIKLHEKMGFVKQHTLGFQYYSSLNPKCAADKKHSLFPKLLNVNTSEANSSKGH